MPSSGSTSSSSRTTSTAASSPDINEAIFEQCILNEELDAEKITDHTGGAVPDVFGCKYDKEHLFATAVVEKIISPILNSDVKVHDIMFFCALIVCRNACLLTSCWLRITVALNLTEALALQVGKFVMRCRHAETGLKELSVNQIIPHNTSLGRSLMDWTILSPCETIVLGYIEFKRSNGRCEPLKFTSDIKQTVCYAVSALAYSRWGVLQQEGTDPIIALLIYQECLYRLSFTKPSSAVNPFGLRLRIEYTDHFETMTLVLKEYVQALKSDYLILEKSMPPSKLVNFRAWSPMNIDMESPDTALLNNLVPNFGFVFTSQASAVGQLKSFCSVVASSGAETAHDEIFVLKYLSALLDIDYEKSHKSIVDVIRVGNCEEVQRVAEEERRVAEEERRVAEEERRVAVEELKRAVEREAELKRLAAELARVTAECVTGNEESKVRQANLIRQITSFQIVIPESTIPLTRDKESEPPGEAPEGNITLAGAMVSLSSGTNVSIALVESNVFASRIKQHYVARKIKHPYVCTLVHNKVHFIVVMRHMGTSLSKLARCATFRKTWLNDQVLRSNFFVDVGQSMLNLVDTIGYCHNDIRSANIANKDESFCVLDFDMASEQVRRGCQRARVLWDCHDASTAKMMFSIGQIALVVFLLDEELEAEREKVLRDLRKTWLEDVLVGSTSSKVANTPFRRWVNLKGLKSVFPEEREAFARASDVKLKVARTRKDFDGMLQSMLGLPSQQKD